MDEAIRQSCQTYWDRVADGYDQVFPETLVGRLQRDAVWRELTGVFRPEQRILELNCGTGVDSVYLANKGVRVLGCDISPRMIYIARKRALSASVASLTEYRVLPTEEIATLVGEQPFDGVFSNFSGLNCVADLSSVARNLAGLLRPGAAAVFCMVGRFTLWESAWHLAHGDFVKAKGRIGANRSTDGGVDVHYPSVHRIVETFAPDFELKDWKGIGIALPPSSVYPLVRQFPKILNHLAGIDRWLACLPGFRNLADCVLLRFERV